MATFTVGANYNTSDGYMGSTGYINRYHDCYILCPPLTTSLPAYATAAKDKIFTPTIYRPTGDVSDDLIHVRLQQDPLNAIGVGTLSTRGATLFVKIGKDGNDAAPGTLRESGTLVPITGSNQNLGTFKEGDALCMGFRAFANTLGLTGQLVFYVVNGSTGSPSLDQIIWRVQFSFGGTAGSNFTNYTGVPIQYSQKAAWLDINTGSTYFNNKDRYAIDYNTVRDPDEYDTKGYNIEMV